MFSLFFIPIIVWGGAVVVGGFGTYVHKKFVFLFWSHKVTPQYLEQLAAVGSGRLECVICLEEFCNHDTVISLQCTHVFHKTCFVSYVNHSFKICPVCRESF